MTIRFRDDPNERLAFFRSASLPGIEVMTAYETSRRWHIFYERYAFCACRKAAAGVRYRGRDDVVTDGCVKVREPGETLCSKFVAKPAEFKILYVDAPLFDELAGELGRRGAVHFPPAPDRHDPELFSALYRLCSVVENGCEKDETPSLLTQVVAALLRHSEDPRVATALTNHRHAVERAKDHLQQRFDEPVSLEELAAVSGLSRFRLVHAFTTEVGISPHAYQLHVRVERARALIERGSSAADAAAKVGFADQSHFARHFKRIMRVTPGEYARALH